MKIKIKNDELMSDIVGEIKDFPKYTTQLINLANQNAQGTRPKIVGQMSDLIQEFKGNKYEDWSKWYQDKKPSAIDDATEKIFNMVLNLQEAITLIDKQMVKEWVKDLVLYCSNLGFSGMFFAFNANRTKIHRENSLFPHHYSEKSVQCFMGKK